MNHHSLLHEERKMKRSSQRRHRGIVWPQLLVILLLSLGAVQQGLDCDRITEPGSRGNRPLGVLYNVELYHEASERIPTVLSCDTEYSFTVVAERYGTECDTFQDWEILYEEAVRQGDARLAQILCPEERCPARDAYLVYQRAGCADGENDGNPVVVLQYVIRCLSEEETLTGGLPLKDIGNVTVPFEDTLEGVTELPESTEHIRSILFVDERATECPYTFHFGMSYEEIVPNCTAVRDYRPYIQKTEVDAMILWNALQCPPGCIKRDLVELHAEWTCEELEEGGARVRVTSAWSVACTKQE